MIVAKCEKCDGTGHVVKIWDGWIYPNIQVKHCDLCHGSGEVPVKDDSAPSPYEPR